MSITELAKPIGFEAAIVKDGKVVGSQWIEREFKPLHDTDIAVMPLQQRVEKVAEMQKNYWEPLLRQDFPDLFTEERPDSISLALTLQDLELKDREAKTFGAEQEKLRDTAIDIFIKDFFLTPAGLRKLSLATVDIAAHTKWTMNDVGNLVQRAGTRLATLKSRDHIPFFAYKNRYENLTSAPDASVLRQNIEYAFAGSDNQTDWERSLGQTSRALLEFFWNNMRDYYTTAETAPTLALTYDLFFAGSFTFDQRLVIRLGEWVEEKLQTGKEKARFRGELNVCYKVSQKEVHRLARDLDKSAAALGEGITFDKLLELLTEDFMSVWIGKNEGRFIIGKNYDRLIGMESTFDFLKSYGMTNLYEQVAGKWREEIDRKVTRGRQVSRAVLTQLQTREDNERKAMIWRKVLNAYDPEHYLLDGIVSCLMDKRQFLERTAVLGAISWRTLVDPQVLQKRISRGEFEAVPKDAREMLLTNAILLNMFTGIAPEDIESTLSERSANEALRRKIAYQNEWFVAANGDQFPLGLNPDLKDYDLSSLTIFPDKKKHGGYRIEMKTGFLDTGKKPIRLILYFNGDGRLYYKDRRPLILPVWLNESVTNLILPRLNYITSGELSRRERDEEITASEDKTAPSGKLERPGVSYRRRPCYRMLTSTPDRKYTLQTAKAQSHAAQVLQDFGVDIYRTNLERRLAGTLADNQVVTIDMGVSDPTASPNQIRYITTH